MASIQSKALVLFAHGARDPRWADPINRIQQLLLQRVDVGVQVHQAYLELMTPTLPALVAELAAQQVAHIIVVPIFLGQGAHVRNDLPRLIQELQSTHQELQFALANDIEKNQTVLNDIADVCLGC